MREQLKQLQLQGVASLAICLLHATANPEHERLVANIAHELGFHNVSVSSQAAPLVKIVPRGDTTVVDAYLNPVLQKYVASLVAAMPGSVLRVLTSAGGLVDAANFSGKDSIFSGPAGGVVGFSRVAQAAGFERAIGFDMGGTSTDVSRFDGRYDLQFENEKAGVRIVAPMMAIETVAAGGGSICRFDGAKLVVGPETAGADPGPACYGRGGSLTITDVNLHLGRICPERFPFPLDGPAAARRLPRWPSWWTNGRRKVRGGPARRGPFADRQQQHGPGNPLGLARQGLRSARLCARRLWRRAPARCSPWPRSWESTES